jgi:hypothetical protein
MPSLPRWPRFFIQAAPTGPAACRLTGTVFCHVACLVGTLHPNEEVRVGPIPDADDKVKIPILTSPKARG